MDYSKSLTKAAETEARLAQLEHMVESQRETALAILSKLDTVDNVQDMKELFRKLISTYLQGQRTQTVQSGIVANNVFVKENKPELSSSANDKDETLFMLSQTTDGQHNDMFRQVESEIQDRQQPQPVPKPEMDAQEHQPESAENDCNPEEEAMYLR